MSLMPRMPAWRRALAAAAHRRPTAMSMPVPKRSTRQRSPCETISQSVSSVWGASPRGSETTCFVKESKSAILIQNPWRVETAETRKGMRQPGRSGRIRSPGTHHPPGWEDQGESAARTVAALDAQLRVVTHGHVLGDGQPQAGAAGGARTAAVGAVEPFRQARNVLGGDADAGVLHGIDGAAVFVLIPADGDGAV